MLHTDLTGLAEFPPNRLQIVDATGNVVRRGAVSRTRDAVRLPALKAGRILSGCTRPPENSCANTVWKSASPSFLHTPSFSPPFVGQPIQAAAGFPAGSGRIDSRSLSFRTAAVR